MKLNIPINKIGYKVKWFINHFFVTPFKNISLYLSHGATSGAKIVTIPLIRNKYTIINISNIGVKT